MRFPSPSSQQSVHVRRRQAALLCIAAVSLLAGVLTGASAQEPGSSTPAATPSAAVVGHPDEATRKRIMLGRKTACVPRGRMLRLKGYTRRKVVALTFDDGPGEATRPMLELLKAKRAKATFFVIGRNAQPDPAVLQQMVLEGHEIGNHSWSHPDLSKGGALATEQLASTNALIGQAIGEAPCIARPPYGQTGPPLEKVAKAQGMLLINWDIDPKDWTGPGPEAIAERVLAGVKRGSIVVMHDGGAYGMQTLAALPAIIAKLRKRGFEFVTVHDLLRLRRPARQ